MCSSILFVTVRGQARARGIGGWSGGGPADVVAEILQLVVMGFDGPVQVLLGALERFRIRRIARESPHIIAEVEYVVESEMAN